MTQAGPSTHPAARARSEGRLVAGLDPFALFCAYHLGITEDGRYRFQNVHDVARRFGVAKDDVDAALRAYAMAAEDLVQSDFDVASAQVDMQVSPAGVDLVGLAAMHWDAFLAAKPRARDWDKELAADAAANEATYGKVRR